MKKLYMVWDNKAQDTAGPYISLNARDEVAVREFSDALHMDGSRLGLHPEDYDLWCLGQIDTERDGEPELDVTLTRFIINGKVLMDAQKEASE